MHTSSFSAGGRHLGGNQPFHSSKFGIFSALFFLLGTAGPTVGFTVTDFAVDPAQATLGDPHQVASPPFNQFQLTIYGSFNVNKCYQVSIKREGGSPCGSANSSGWDTAIVFADRLVADISPTQQNADFKAADNWRIEIRQRNAGCTGSSSTQVFPDSPGESYLKILGCNNTCLLSNLTMTVSPNPVGCGGSVQVCALKSGGGVLGSGNLEYDWDINGDGVCGVCSGGSNSGKKCSEAGDCPGGTCYGTAGFADLTTHTGDPGCAFGQPCCITVTVAAAQTIGVKVRDLGTQIACTDCKTKSISVTNNCSDGLYCNGSEVCTGSGCAPGTPPNCADSIACTVDACNESTDSCTHTPDNSACNDGLFCNGTETCHATLGCKPGSPVNCTDGVSCTVDACDEGTDSCTHTPNHSACSDGKWCNGDEVCHPVHGCKPGTPRNCNDNVACTIDSCNEAGDNCINKPSNSLCDDGLWCNGVETCHPTLGCQPGTPPNCNDGIACTTDSCNEATDSCVHTPVNSVCSDGLYCNGAETCHPTQGCKPGTPVVCNDGVSCTSDACDEATDSCKFTPNNGACSDGQYCNGAEICHPTLGCKPGTAVNCNDGIPCTTDSCNEATDSCVNTPNNNACSDGQFCNGTEVCHPTLGCQSGTPPVCNDGVPCTTDSCNEATDSCDFLPNNSACDDGLYCNGAEFCHPALGCKSGTPPNCSDGVPCTTDTCNEATDSCDYVPNHAACSDGLYCNGSETCDPTQGCLNGAPVNCSDGVACTVDTCDESADSCVHAPDDLACGNGLFCDGQEICDPVLGCVDGVDPCNAPTICDEPNDRCVNCVNNAQCDDGVFCNGVETCHVATGTCVSGTPPPCDDGVACTIDSCNTATDACENTPNHGTCSDGQYCNGTEFCHPTQGCQAGSPVVCDDSVNCTVDSCNESTDSCVYAPNDAACSDGLYCTGNETCHPTLGCQAGVAPNCNDGVTCTVDACDEANDVCTHTPSDSLCDDGQFCTGVETCDPVAGCQAGTPPVCNDGVGCTVDVCDESTDSCLHMPSNSLCGDGQYCNGTEVCDPLAGCQAGTPVTCDDSVACTVDACNEATDTCDHVPNHGACSDGQYCNGAEFCHPTQGCQAGAPPNCNDGVGCTQDSCDESNDSCVHLPSHGACDDGAWCNGAEVCDPVGGCQAGTAPNCNDGVPCTVDSCDEATDSCVYSPNAAVCNDGHYCNGTESCHPTLGCQAGSPVSCDDGVACTADECDEDVDACVHLPNHGSCSDGLHCNGVESCHPTLGCQPGQPVTCNDDVPCTVDVCNEQTDSCDNTPDSQFCDDGQYCNGVEFCHPMLGCQPGTVVVCDDGVPCTSDSCDENLDSCVHVPGDSACDDGLWCNGIETCHPAHGCLPGTPPNCMDSVSCTIDLCDEAGDACVHVPNHEFCDNSTFCDGSESCDPLLGCVDNPDPCAPPTLCDEPNGRCVECLSNEQCNDGQFCNGVETCDTVTGACVPGTPPVCNDGLACTSDACDPGQNACVYTPVNSNCDDGQFCNGSETCHPTSGCQPGTPVTCDDGVACTNDYCDEVNDACAFVPNDAACSDGLFCDGAEVCHPTQGCLDGPDPCPISLCDEAGDRCVNCLTNADCGDGVFCNGEEVCHTVSGTCMPGLPPDCNDGVSCTVDACSPSSDSCVHTPSDSLCSDGQFCNGIEVCHPAFGCLAGVPVNCNDGVGCTVDSCNEAADECRHVPSDSLCADSSFCNGVEVCDPVNGCQGGTAVVCDDAISCTVDACDESSDSCLHVPDNGACNDGEYCNGVETCDASLGCLAGVGPECDDGVACTADSCNETTDSCDHVPDHGSCDNGFFCDGVEACDAQHGCVSGTAPICNDGVTCTVDACEEASNTCSHTPVDSACDDQQFCNGIEYCDPTNGCQAGAAPNCSDGVGCTVDLCDENVDICVHVPNASLCDDGQFCNGVEVCDPQMGCVAGVPVVCDDGVDCTADSCDETADACVNDPVHHSCDNGLFCDGVEVCDSLHGCQPGVQSACAPGLYCDETADVCVECLTDAHCEDDDFCNGVATCESGTCMPGTPPSCDDGIPCTVDSCDPQGNACANVPNDQACGDGVFCNGVETCSPTQGCLPGAPPVCDDGLACTVDVCDAAIDACTSTPNHDACSDGAYCNGTEVCHPVEGCIPGLAPVCDDGVGCTVDSCDESTDACVHSPSDTLCSDSQYCNGEETCDPVNGCRPGTSVTCNDGVACTVDSCDEETDSCASVPNHSACSDGQFCNGAEVCDPIQGCQAGPPVSCDDQIACTVDSCNEAKDVCVHSPNKSACQDGLFCNGEEVCVVGVGCQAGAAPNCNDGIACTTDACNEDTDSCVFTPHHSSCDDGQFCNGVEVCDVVEGCQAGAPVSCNDGVGCTLDSCNEATDACVSVPLNELCSDGAWCNGVEICKAGVGCAPGVPPNCADMNPCTIDSCDESLDQCRHVPSDAICDDGIECTVDSCTASGCRNETMCGACCTPSGDCVDGVTAAECQSMTGETSFHGPGSDCRGDQNRNGVDDLCGADQIPTVSEWGMVVMALLLLIGAKLRFGLRRLAF